MESLAVTYQGFSAMQENTNFLAIFSALYLAVSDILLTHTHTGAPSLTSLLFSFVYARAKRIVTLINKGLFVVPFVCFFMPFCEEI